MEYNHAAQLASELYDQLKPHCEKIAIAGSIRRKKLHVKDIEIVLIPKPFEVGLFESGIAAILNALEIKKGSVEGKYTQRVYKGATVDVFIVEHGNWGSQLAMRTGPSEYSHKVLGRSWVRLGYKMEGGYLTINGRPIATPTEKEFFNRIGVEMKHPMQRK